MKLFLLVAVITALTHASDAGGHDGPPQTCGPAFERLDRDDALVVMVNFQEGFIGAVGNVDIALLLHNMLAHCALAQVFDLPVIYSPHSQEEHLGAIPRELLEMHPNATIVTRDFTATNAWDSEEFREAVQRSGKSQIILAGLTTDGCVTHSALSMRDAGYSVWVNAEASATSDDFVRDMGIQRMVRGGVNVVSTGSVLLELVGSGPADGVPQFFDTYLPRIGLIRRAWEHAAG